MNEFMYLENLCGVDSGWEFWSPNRTVNTPDPDFTLCFENTVFPWLITVYALLLLIIYIPYLYSIKFKNKKSRSRLNYAKIILTLTIALINLIDLILTSIEMNSEKGDNNVILPSALLMNNILEIFSKIIIAFVIAYEFKKGIHSSGMLFFYWFICLIISIITFRTQIKINNSSQDYYVDETMTWKLTFCVLIFIINLVVFILQCFADQKALAECHSTATKSGSSSTEKVPLIMHSSKSEYSNHYHSVNNGDGDESQIAESDLPFIDREPSPAGRVSFFKDMTFLWMTPLVMLGYKRPLTMNDLHRLRPNDACSKIIPELEKNWEIEIAAFEKRNKNRSSYDRLPSKADITSKSKDNGDEESAMKARIEKEKKISKADKPSFLKAIIRSFGLYYIVTGATKLITDALSFAQPTLLNLFISFITNYSLASKTGETIYVWHGFAMVFGLFLIAIANTLIFQNFWHACYTVGMRLRTGIIGLIYRKALKMSSSSRKDKTVGEIVNLMSVDAQKLQDIPGFMHFLWSAPLVIIVAIFYLYQEVGPAVFAGLGITVLLIPINGFLAAKQKAYQRDQMRWKDQRIKLLSEILNGVKVLKLYAWEKSFQEKVTEIRTRELKILRSAAYLNAVASITFFCSPFLIGLTTFAVYVLSDPSHVLDANKAFVSLTLFNIMNMPLMLLPGLITALVQALVSIDRINRFLIAEELDTNAVVNEYGNNNRIEIRDGEFTWDSENKSVLKGINFSITDGKLLAVVGSVGSGKSSLMNAILGELHKVNGTVHVRGSVAYVPQQAWCQNATLRDNILFGKTMDSEKYRNVIHTCALKPDLEVLPGGDSTEIGEKGINLSGGQKQRISLARAAYQDQDIYILDDPLSAVDSHVGKHIFEKMIGPNGFLKDKTRILVTHGLSNLPQVDEIIVLKDGVISEIGSYQQLLSRNGAFAEFVKTYLENEDEKKPSTDSEEDSELDEDGSEGLTTTAEKLAHEEDELEFKKQLRKQISHLSGDQTLVEGTASEESSKYVKRHKDKSLSKAAIYERSISKRRSRQLSRRQSSMIQTMKSVRDEEDEASKKKLIRDETTETGSVNLAVFLIYLKAVGQKIIWIVIVTYLLYMLCSVGANIWLSDWSENSDNGNGTQNAATRDYYLGIYGALGCGQIVFVLLENLAVAYGTYKASTALHKYILYHIMKAPMSFFDTTPLGRIINRFGKDIDSVDLNIPVVFRMWLSSFAGVLSSILIMTIATYYFAIALIPLGLFYYFSQRIYICTSRQLKRIDSVRRSPIYSHFQESLVGAASIRAYNMEHDFTVKSDVLVNENQMAWFPNIASNRWLGINLEIVGGLMILLTGIFAVLSGDTIGPGLAGLAVTYALQITFSLNYLVRMSCDLENYIVAVERIDEYAKIETEADWESSIKLPTGWPNKGQIEFSEYSLKYREGLDLVLKDVNCKIKSCEKVGIVGRTGAGKSSLTLGLFRILEAARGKILIDDVDVSTLGLHQLRSRITVIPQDPIIFSGTLRMNLDPFDQHHDGEVWYALEQAHLKQFVTSQADGLNFVCSEGGDNLSVGQRQLLCLARALLRKTKILVLDEATAAVDLETDSLIQNTIRREFKDCTVLTIAHRLNTIMDYDKVMVLDRGRIHEFDSPQKLLSNDRSIFYGMAKDASLV